MQSPWFGDFFVDLQDLGEIGHVQGQIRSHLCHEDLHLTGGGGYRWENHGKTMGRPWENGDFAKDPPFWKWENSTISTGPWLQ